jgi:hypothetical protein
MLSDVKRLRTVLGPVEHPCSLCGSTDVVRVEARTSRTGLNRLNPRWDPHAHAYDECRSCGAKDREAAP